MKLFRRRKPEIGEEEDELLFAADTEVEDAIQEPTALETAGPMGPLAQAEAIPTADDPLAQISAEAAGDIAAAEKPPEGDPASPQPPDSLDAGLMDLFREAKNEVQESTLASDLEDIPVEELLGDLVSISERLGIRPRVRGGSRQGSAPDGGP